ncbi:MAG TPA: hypothetical protein VN639_11920 [Azonexus sp.]|nr:hypothetical protein [Azonexus sp.]
MVARLIALLAISGSVLAADGGSSPEQQADWQQRLDNAAALQAEARARQAEADERLAQKNSECLKKFRVNACQDEARAEHMAVMREVRRQENKGKAAEREVKKEQLADHDQRAAETARQRAADLRVREAETAAARQAVAAEEAATRADKATKAEEGARRKAAEAEKQRKKQADHEARVAEKMRKADRRAADAAGK